MGENFDNLPSGGEITFAGIGRLIKKSALRVLIYIIIVAVAVSLIVLPIKMYVHPNPSVTARIEFIYSGIEEGLDPNGTVFDKSKIKNNTVLTTAIANAGLENKIPVVADLRDSVIISDVVSAGYQELKYLAASGNTEAQTKLLNYSFYPTRFDISIERFSELGLTKSEALNLLDCVLSAYRDYFTERYANRTAFVADDFDLEDDVEYISYYIRYETQLSAISSYVDSISGVDANYVASNGKSFAALKSMYSVLSEELDSFYLFILNDKVAKDKTIAASEIGEIVQQLSDEKMTIENEITSLQTQIENYKPNTETTSTANGTSNTVIIEFGEGYDELQNQLRATYLRSSEVTKRHRRYERLQKVFEDASTPTDAEILALAAEKVIALKANCLNYINTVNQTVYDYFTERYSSNAIRTIQSPAYARNTLDIPLLYIYVLAVVLAIAVGMIVTYAKGKALEINLPHRNRDKIQEPEEAE